MPLEAPVITTTESAILLRIPFPFTRIVRKSRSSPARFTRVNTSARGHPRARPECSRLTCPELVHTGANHPFGVKWRLIFSAVVPQWLRVADRQKRRDLPH